MNFRGNARDALAFYQSVFTGDLTAFTYREAQAVTDPAEADQIIWGQVLAEDGFHIMACDIPSATLWEPGTIPVFVSVRGEDAEKINRYWKGLVEGGTIVRSPAEASLSPLYGMVRDRFGITWVLDVQAAYPAS
ncbi:VOC family protein [Pseudoroseomonas ludipueritiae]|uniref:VOC family protein n=1 Tax=Pseudoroseomonas ludipueritiae TaxID=198093 RepID=UPI001EEEFF0B|nr:VOC family protein [Pseudoroseomonas ludipueritiae]